MVTCALLDLTNHRPFQFQYILPGVIFFSLQERIVVITVSIYLQLGCNLLTASTLYNQWSAGILIAIYALMMMPVQMWHAHRNISDQRCVTSRNCSTKQILTTAIKSSEDSCNICAYKFSTHFRNFDCREKVGSYVFSQFTSFQLPFTPFWYCKNLSNKGPPSLA